MDFMRFSPHKTKNDKKMNLQSMDSEWVVARGSSGGGGGSGGNDNATVLFYFFFIIAHCATIIIIYARIYLWMELNNCVDDVDVIGFF